MFNALPKCINIYFKDKESSLSIPGIVVAVTIFAKEKNDYGMVPRPSDENGCIVLTSDWFSEQIRIANSTAIMDYSSLIKDELLIEVLPESRIDNVVNYMKTWKDILHINESEINQVMHCSNRLYKTDSVFLTGVSKQEVNHTFHLDKIRGRP